MPELVPIGDCPHTDFEAGFNVNRVVNDADNPTYFKGIFLQVWVRCRGCGKQFRFVGPDMPENEEDTYKAPYTAEGGYKMNLPLVFGS